MVAGSALHCGGLLTGDPDWRPFWRDDEDNLHPWNDEAYQDLRNTISSIPPGNRHDAALDAIKRLDCANKTLASCDPSSPPAVVGEWLAREPRDPQLGALARELKRLVCSGDEFAVYIVRGDGFGSRLQDAFIDQGDNLFADLMNKDSKDCPVSGSLTDRDRTKLVELINSRI
jgi:hypothetical protein